MECNMNSKEQYRINLTALSWTILGFIIIYLVGTSFILDLSHQRGYFVADYMDRTLALAGVLMAGGIFRSKSELIPSRLEFLILWISFVLVAMMKMLFIAYFYTPSLLSWQMIGLNLLEKGSLIFLLTFLSLYIGGLLFSRTEAEEEFWDEEMDGRAWL